MGWQLFSSEESLDDMLNRTWHSYEQALRDLNESNYWQKSPSAERIGKLLDDSADFLALTQPHQSELNINPNEELLHRYRGLLNSLGESLTHLQGSDDTAKKIVRFVTDAIHTQLDWIKEEDSNSDVWAIYTKEENALKTFFSTGTPPSSQP